MARLTTVPDVFNQAAFLVDRHLDEGRADKIAIYTEGRQITYAKLASQVNRTGNALKALGVEMENRVMILMPDRPEFLYTYLGAMKIGAVPIPVNTLASSKDYQYFLNDSRAKVLVIAQDLLPKVQAIGDSLPYLRHTIVVGSATGETLSYDTLVSAASDKLEPASTSKDDMAFWMYTSGTTGLPKAVVHLHHDIVYYMYPFCEEVLKMTGEDRIYATSKMFFSYGRNASLEIPLLYGASTILRPDWPDTAKVVSTIQQYKPTILFSVPTFYTAMLRDLDKNILTCDFSSVRLCLSSGEPMPRELWERWKTRSGAPTLDVIGSTDAGAQYLSNRVDQVRPGASGKILPGFESRLRDAEGNEVPQGQVGTLWLKNDGVASHYWNKHQRSKEVFQGEWFNTGDLFYQDADEYYWYQGRADDMMKISGQWVSPLEIEETLQKHPAVRECGVVGVPDDSGLARVRACIVLDDAYEATPEMEKELATFVHDRIAHFKTPRWVLFVQELPRTTTGKLQRHKLRQG